MLAGLDTPSFAQIDKVVRTLKEDLEKQESANKVQLETLCAAMQN